MKNKILTLALLFVMSFTLTACTLQDLPVIGGWFGGGGMGAVSGDVKVWYLWEDPQVMKVLIDNYVAQRPNVKVSTEDRSILTAPEYRDRIFSRAGSDVGADVILVHSTWVSRLKDSLAPMPSKLMTTAAFQKDFYPVASQNAVIDGKIYGIPFSHEGLVLVYNKTHFAQIGQQDPPTAWEEFRRIAGRLTIRDPEDEKKILRSGAAIGNASNITHFSDILGLMLVQANVSIPSDLDSAEAISALDYYTTFVMEDRIWDASFPREPEAFAQGKVSMIIVPTWQVNQILKANPSIDLGVAPVPQALPSQPTAWASYWLLAVPSSSNNQAAAWDFINFVTSEEQELALFSEGSKVRAFGQPFARVNLAQQAQNNPFVKPLLDQASYSKSVELGGKVGNTVAETALARAVDSVLAGMSPEEAMKNLKAGK